LELLFVTIMMRDDKEVNYNILNSDGLHMQALILELFGCNDTTLGITTAHENIVVRL